MKIKKITYYSVPRSESGTCACCGKSIQNICSVETVEGEHFNFGTTCFDKLIKDKLQSFQRKEYNQAIKFLKGYCKQQKIWEDMTEEDYLNSEMYRTACICDGGAPWEIKVDLNSFEDYKNWMVNDFFPYRIEQEEKVIEKYSRIDF